MATVAVVSVSVSRMAALKSKNIFEKVDVFRKKKKGIAIIDVV
jgi:hypothetical protein